MEAPQRIKIFNAQIITPSRIINNGSVLVIGDKIAAVSEDNIDAPDAILVDANGKYVSPGFIDIHIHGGGEHR